MVVKIWDELKERRITQIVIAYLAGGWIAVTVVDSLVDRQILPELVFRLALVAFIGGIVITLILGWYHGEKGSQKVTIPEIALLTMATVVTVASGILVTSRHLDAERGVVLEVGVDARRVAVLYFDDLSASGDLGYLADGLTESLISELSRIPELDVISRDGVARFRNGSLPPERIGTDLNVGSLIGGSVEPARGGVRVNVQLLDGPSGASLGRTAFTVPDAELMAARDSVVAMAGEFLRSRLGEQLRLRELRSGAETVAGWTLYQRAERLRKDASDAAHHDRAEALAMLAEADALLAEAEAGEPRWADPSALRADLALRRGAWARTRAEALQAVEAGVAHADEALARQPGHARALEIRGNLHRLHWWLDVSPTPRERAELLDRAERDLAAAVTSDPGLASAHALLSRLYYDRRDLLSAALAAREALRADYYLADADAVLHRAFSAHFDLGQFSEAQGRCAEGARRFPDLHQFVDCRLWLMVAPWAEAEPDPDAAWSLRARADSLTPSQVRPLQSHIREIAVAGVLARAGMPDSARTVLAQVDAGPEIDPDQHLLGYEAIIRVILGEQDEAVRQLRRYVTGNPDHAEGLLRAGGELHWFWRPLRDHPDFQTLLRPGG